TPLAKRFGGYYVTGTWGRQSHFGNLTSTIDVENYQEPRGVPGRGVRLEEHFDVGIFPAAHSDIVALLVHDHQTSVHNLLTRVNYGERLGQWRVTRQIQGIDAVVAVTEPAPETVSATEEQLVRALLLADAVQFSEPISGDTLFARMFEQRSPMNLPARSMREL